MSSTTIIVGGGVIGLSLAYELAGQGRAVRVLEQAQFGQEASWAGAGILPPGNLEMAETPEARLRSLSHRLWPKWTQQLQEETGIDNGFVPCGSMEVRVDGPSDGLALDATRWREEGVVVEDLTVQQLQESEPEISGDVVAGYRLPDTAQVRNPRHLKALIAGCAKRGVELLAGQPVTRLEMRSGCVNTVRTATGHFSADAVCITTGAWSRMVLEPIGIALPIVPVRGQIVLLSLPSPAFRHVIECGPRYLVPRPDGRVLVGSTEERAGFEKRNTAAGVRGLIEFATQLVPKLADATLEKTWAGLRPHTSDGLPFLGRIPQTENLFLAAGHFRAGLQMSPGTAAAMVALINGDTPPIDMTPYSIERISQKNNAG